jgi:hypothetical protein
MLNKIYENNQALIEIKEMSLGFLEKMKDHLSLVS